MPASTILLVDSDAASAGTISGVLARAGYTVTTVADADEAFAKAVEHQVVIIDTVAGSRSALDLCREIRGTPALAAIPVLCVSQTDQVEERIGFLEAGADDVLAKPFDDRELEARVEALLLRFQRSKNLAPALLPEGTAATMHARRIIAVYSPKGGTGTTTIATNIASVMSQRRPDRTVLVDLDLQFGQVATHLNLTPRQTIADVVRDDAALKEPELLRTYVSRHETGLHVLAAPPSPELAELITPDHVDEILGGLAQVYDAVVVDAGSHLDERILTVFERAEGVVFPVYPEIAALKALHTLLDYLNEAGSLGGKSTFVLNNVFARELLKLRDVESALGTKITLDLPYDTFLYLKAVNEGVPIVRGAPKSAPAERLTKLAATVFGDDDSLVLEAPGERRPRRLGGLLRRA